MRYEELVARVAEAMKLAKVSRQVGHVAFQFNVEGEAEGIFYLEIADGKVNVEPYEYYDRDLIIVTSADVIIQMLEGKLTPRVAFTNGQIKVYGDSRQLEVLPMGCECKKCVIKATVAEEAAVESEVKAVEEAPEAPEAIEAAKTE